MNNADKKQRHELYYQGLANLKIEGMELTRAQHKIVLAYQSGKISRKELIEKALRYARSR